MLTVSNHQGDTTYDSFIVKGDPSHVKWNPFKDSNKDIMCCIVSNSKLFVFNPKTQENQYIAFDKSANGKP